MNTSYVGSGPYFSISALLLGRMKRVFIFDFLYSSPLHSLHLELDEHKSR